MKNWILSSHPQCRSRKRLVMGGVASIREITEGSPPLLKLDLVGKFKEEFGEYETHDAGKFEGSLGKSIVEEDNRKCQIMTIARSGGRNLICREKRAGGLSTFCLKVDCSINHRNGGSPKIKVKDDDMIVLK